MFAVLRLQLFDAIIVLTSFSLDVVFIQGITGNSEEAIALLIIFLLWRILRIINGTIQYNTIQYSFIISLSLIHI